MSNKPADRSCTQCGNILHAEIHGYTVDANFNSVPCYMFGHMCPAQFKKYDDRINQINSSEMNEDQRNNARNAAGMQNGWAS